MYIAFVPHSGHQRQTTQWTMQNTHLITSVISPIFHQQNNKRAYFMLVGIWYCCFQYNYFSIQLSFHLFKLPIYATLNTLKGHTVLFTIE